MYLSAGNALQNPNVGMLLVDFENQKRLRVNGVAQILAAAPSTAWRWTARPPPA
jgi:hypothetical protein